MCLKRASLVTFLCFWMHIKVFFYLPSLAVAQLPAATGLIRPIWSNAAVGQQERRAWWGQNRRQRTAGRTLIPTPAPGLLIQTPTLQRPLPRSRSRDADGRSRRRVNFPFKQRGRAGVSCACASRLNKQSFLAGGRLVGAIGLLYSCGGGGGGPTLGSKSSSEAQNAGNAAGTSRKLWELRGASRSDKAPFQR